MLVDKCTEVAVPPAPQPVMTPTLYVPKSVCLTASAKILFHCGTTGSALARNNVHVRELIIALLRNSLKKH